MKSVVLSGKAIVFGKDSLEYLKTLEYRRTFVVTGGRSMIKFGVIDKVKEYMGKDGKEVFVYSGIGKNPTIQEVDAGLKEMKEFQPDLVLAVGGGSAMDAAKAMILFYEFPQFTFDNILENIKSNKVPVERKKAGLICIPSTSGTGTEVTKGAVITDPDKNLKIPILTPCLRPDVAILDKALPMTMPSQIAAETGMDALTHAIEAYTNHNLDDYDAALCEGAIKGIMDWLPVSCNEATEESREKMHNYQCMAGIAFANVGLGMVHGIAHSWGGIYNLAHGLTNAVVLPFALEYNKRDIVVAAKLAELSYLCRCGNIIGEIAELKTKLGIPYSFQEFGVKEEDYKKDFDLLLDHAMLGATNVNPVKMTEESMIKMLDAVYYGKKIDF